MSARCPRSPESMIEIRLLGAQSVQAADGHEILSVSTQPKRVALLAYLALASDSGDGYVSRDELLALFWPESDDEHARNTLNQHLYRLRVSLGSDAIPSHGTNRVGVDPAEVWCDAAEFRRALENDEPERALELYAGELLPGFHLSGTPELEKWLDHLRLDLQRRALDVALRLARENEAAGERTAAAGWYRKAHDISPESEVVARGLAAASSPSLRGAARVKEANERRLDRSLLPSGAALVVTALAIGGWWASSSRERIPDPEPRLAILPFDNLTGDPAQNHLIDLVHDEVIREAGAAGGLLVISRTSVMVYGDSTTALPEIGRQLDADALVEATVRALRDSIHVQVRLLDAASERSLWANRYGSAREDTTYLTVLLPRLIANEVRKTLNPEASLDLEPPPLPDPAAIQAFVRGREYLARGGPEGLEAAIDQFDLAVAFDPQFAEAWAGLGRAWEYSGGWFGHRSPVDAMPEAQTAYEMALALDSTLAEAYAGIANIEWRYRWRWAEAERAFRRSIELNPNLADVRDHYGNFLRSMRRVEEGVVQLEKAVELDPLGLSWAELRQHYQHLGRFDEARRAAERARELHPAHPASQFIYAIEMWGNGERLQAADTLAAAGLYGFAAQFYAAAGAEEDARSLLTILESQENRNHLPIAYTYLFLGDTMKALDWLELGVRERHAHMVWLNIAAEAEADGYEPMIADFPKIYFAGPRYEAIMERLDFPDPPA